MIAFIPERNKTKERNANLSYVLLLAIIYKKNREKKMAESNSTGFAQRELLRQWTGEIKNASSFYLFICLYIGKRIFQGSFRSIGGRDSVMIMLAFDCTANTYSSPKLNVSEPNRGRLPTSFPKAASFYKTIRKWFENVGDLLSHP